METGSWSPPIPSGAVAVDAWKRLDRRTRRDLLRSAAAHPDPSVAAVAVGYARTNLGGRWWLRSLRSVWFAPVTCGVATLLVVSGSVRRWPQLSALVFASCAVAFLWDVVRVTRLRLALIRMENANAPSLLAGETVTSTIGRADPVQAGVGESLIVGYDGKTLVRWYAGVAVPWVAAVAVSLVGKRPILYVPAIVAAILLTLVSAYFVILAVMGIRPGRRAAVLDREGISSPFFDVHVDWREVVEVRVLPQRASVRAKTRHRVVAFVLADPEGVLERIGGVKAKGARLDHRYYGSPLAMADQILDHSADEIAAAVQNLTPVPVRRFDG
ncbi:hypothetical protein [Actinomadura sp. HBU206391]|uniref:hypothetical protein n=1 Tax=Actinomadura sp. HBU206391 TaxID=2731692 RepID=UPI00164FA2D0|nr:hypothetical protein [Actinomadura sp. HBU206391]MBC6458877.1 hypothetical protein [Actinomadura sp. HBU206391]